MPKRNLLYFHGKASGDLSKYRSSRNKVTLELRRAKTNFFQRMNYRTPKEFWRAIKYLSKHQHVIPTLVDENESLARTASEKAAL